MPTPDDCVIAETQAGIARFLWTTYGRDGTTAMLVLMLLDARCRGDEWQGAPALSALIPPLSDDTVRRRLQLLRQRGWVEHLDGDRTGRWRLTDRVADEALAGLRKAYEPIERALIEGQGP